MTRLLGTYRRGGGGVGGNRGGGVGGVGVAPPGAPGSVYSSPAGHPHYYPNHPNYYYGMGGVGGGRGNHHASSCSSLFSRQSLMILIFGILTGYVLVPMVILEVGFEDLLPTGMVTEKPQPQPQQQQQQQKHYHHDQLQQQQSSFSKTIGTPQETKISPVMRAQDVDEDESYSNNNNNREEEIMHQLHYQEQEQEQQQQQAIDLNGISLMGDDGGHHSFSSAHLNVVGMGGMSRNLVPEGSGSSDEIRDTDELVHYLLQHLEEKNKNENNGESDGQLIRKGVAVTTADTPMMDDATKRIVHDRNVISTQSLPTSTTPYVMKTKFLPDHQRKKILVTGGAGFVGSHLVDKLMMEGHEVIVLDNFFTGQKKNIAHWLHHPNFSLVVHDVIEPIKLEVDQIYHLACPASPPHYQYNPVKTIKTSTMGTLNMLGLAKRVKARILLTSTSEIYGDPQEHPQKESYWGNVNTIGPRSCYDEGKRVAETMMYSYRNQNNVQVRVARIFNTFGARMHPNDGRVVSNFIIQALQNKNMTIYGTGEQTRSFQYVSDLVNGLHALMNGQYDLPVNLGNPDEYSVTQFAKYVQQMTKSQSHIVYLEKSIDDPTQRRPDISTAKKQLDWEPRISVEQGLRLTIDYFQRVLDESGEIIPTGPGAAKPEA